MPRPKTSDRDRDGKPRKTAAGAKTRAKESAAASSKPPAQSRAAPAEMTVEKLIRELKRTRREASQRGHSAAAVSALLAIGRILGLMPDKPGRQAASPHKPRLGAAPLPKFDGNYNEAARRVLFLLGLAAKQRAEETEEAGKANGERTKT